MRDGTAIRRRVCSAVFLPSWRTHGRCGLVVPKYMATAVQRNRLKRLVRSLVPALILPRLGQLDVVIRLHPIAYQLPVSALAEDLSKLGRSLERAAPQ